MNYLLNYAFPRATRKTKQRKTNAASLMLNLRSRLMHVITFDQNQKFNTEKISLFFEGVTINKQHFAIFYKGMELPPFKTINLELQRKNLTKKCQRFCKQILYFQ